VDFSAVAAAQEKTRRVVRAEQRADNGHDGARPHAEDLLDPVGRVGMPDERGMIHHAGRESGVLLLDPGREDDVVGGERRSAGLGAASWQREILDDDINVCGAGRQIDHFAVGLDQGHAVQRLTGGMSEPVSEIVGVDPPGRWPGFGEREAVPLRRPAGSVRLVVGPVHEVVYVFSEHRHPARLNVEDVVPMVAFPLVRYPGVPVFGAPFDQYDLHGLPGELEKAYGGSGATQTCSDDDNSARQAEVVQHVTKSPSTMAATAGRIPERMEDAVAGDFTGQP